MRKSIVENGFARSPSAVIPPNVVAAALEGVYAVMKGEYETGQAPLDAWYDGDDSKLRKIDNPHISNNAIKECVTHPNLAEAVKEALQDTDVQIWAVQLIHKPSTKEGSEGAAVGFHQDWNYWHNWWTPESEVLTMWIALTDVQPDCGPMVFLPASHKYGLLKEGNDFFGKADEKQQQSIRESLPKECPGAETEVLDVLPPGGFSLHHRLLVHGSRQNTSGRPRVGLAVHLAITNKSTPTPGCGLNPTDPHSFDYVAHLDDPTVCPFLCKS